MQAGDIIFVVKEDFIGEAIEFFDHGNFSHVTICIDDNNNILETDLFTNAQIVPFHYKDYEIVKLKLTQEQRDKIPKIAKSLIGIKYNYLIIIWYILKKFFNLKKPWRLYKHEICSKNVDHVLFEIGAISESIFMSEESPNIMYQRMKKIGIK